MTIKPEYLFRHNTVVHSQLTDLLMNYNNIWLLLALETMFSLECDLSFTSDNLDSFLRKSIANKVLWNPLLAQKYAVRKNTSLFSTREFEEELHRCILKRYFTIVYFLDVAKRRDLLPGDINLFREKSLIKSSSDMMMTFTSLFLKSEGYILKKLNTWGCAVSYVQLALDDYDFAVSNLSKDISDGVRLA